MNFIIEIVKTYILFHSFHFRRIPFDLKGGLLRRTGNTDADIFIGRCNFSLRTFIAVTVDVN